MLEMLVAWLMSGSAMSANVIACSAVNCSERRQPDNEQHGGDDRVRRRAR